jgi:beta-glucosidase-like glycosyl hydrolase
MEKKITPMAKLPSFLKIKTALSLRQKVGQLFMPAAFINDSEEEVQKLELLIKEYDIGSICFFHSRASAATNFEGKKEVVHNENSYERLLYLIDRYQQAAEIPLLIAIDAEWGLAMRIENTPQYPYAISLGAMQNQEKWVEQVGASIARDCREAGIHWNLSPVVDINLNPENPVIGYRSFGDDRKKVTDCAKAYLRGMQSQGVLNSIKHFPGHGDTATDSHLGLPVIDKHKDELLNNEVYPFTQLLDEGIDSVMVGHLAVPALSNGRKVAASISKEIMTDFLRDELGWNGLIISDALNMHAISKDFPEKGTLEHTAFEAGNDVLCFADHITQGIAMIAEKCNPERIEASFERLWQLKVKAFHGSQEQVGNATKDYDKLMHHLASESLTELHGDAEKIATFREAGFQLLQLGKQGGYFQEALKEKARQTSNHLLLNIVPRQVKPNNNFGFTTDELESMHTLINQGNAIIYLFGNPFVLNLLPWEKAKTVVVAYQDFDAFQKQAVEHFRGKIAAKGRLPVNLKQSNG